MRSCIRKMSSVLGLIFLGVIFLVGEAQVLTPAFVQTRDTRFMLNGSSFLFNGFNSYWMMQVAADPNQRYKVSKVFLQAYAAGLRVCRTWAFSDGGDQALQKSPGVYDESFFQALDFVISEARRYDMKLILTLTNNYPNYGGRHQYVQWARNAGAAVTGDDDFYTNAIIKGYYKNNVKTLLTRMNTITKLAYKEDPTIMAWELLNEPRCQVDESGATLNGWIKEMAAYVKSIDDKHLLAVGMEGFFGDSTPDRIQYNPKAYKYGTDFINNNLIEGIDFATIHAYTDVWLAGESDKTQMEFMHNWLNIHWSDSKTILKKPLVFTEFGKSRKDPGFSVQSRDSFLMEVYSYIYNFASTGGTIAGGLVWQIMSEAMESYYDGYEIILPQSPSTSNIIQVQSTKMISLGHSR